MTSHQSEVLRKLYQLSLDAMPDQYWRANQIGAMKGSHHHKTLLKLVQLGWVTRTMVKVEGCLKPVFMYRITEEGAETWKSFMSLTSIPLQMVLGRALDKRRATVAMHLART